MKRSRVISFVVVVVLGISMFLVNNSASAEGEDNVREIGTALHSTSVAGWTYGKNLEGDEVIYSISGGDKGVFNAINPTTGKVINRIPLEGISDGWAITTDPAGNVYMGSDRNGKMYRYDLESKEIDGLGKVVDGAGTIYDLVSDEKGRIYGGSYPGGELFRYDPETDEFKNYGQLLDEQKYVRKLDIDLVNNMLYVGTGSKRPRLVQVDLETDESKEIDIPDKYDGDGFVYDVDLVDNKLFIRITPAETVLVYDLNTLEITDEIENVDSMEVSQPDENNVVYMIVNGSLTGYDLNTQDLEQTKVNNIKLSRGFGWFNLKSDNFPGKTLVFITKDGHMHRYNPQTNHYDMVQGDLKGQPLTIHSLTKGPDDKIYVGGFLTGELAAYDPETDEIEEFKGIEQIEGMVSHKDKLYMGVYPGAHIFSYDPEQPFEIGENPVEEFNLKNKSQDRPYALISAGNQVAIGSVPDYGKLGGALTLLDPDTGDYESHRNIVEDHSIVSLHYDGDYIYGGSTVWGGLGADPLDDDAKLFIWDTNTNKKVYETEPIPGEKSISALTMDDDGYLWGLTAGNVFKFNPETREVVDSKEYYSMDWDSVNQFYGHVSDLIYDSNDGYLYGKIQNEKELVRIDPVTWEKETLLNKVEYVTMNEGENFYISRGDDKLYEYNVEHSKSPSKQLSEWLEKANKFDSSAYTKDSWAELEVAMNKAEKLHDQTKVDEKKLTDTKNALKQGINELEKLKETDKQNLKNLVDDASTLKEANFSEDSWSSFQKSLKEAQEVLEDEKATQETVDDALDNLTKQMNELEKKEDKKEPNKEDLRDAISDAEKKKDSDYTSDSWDKFQKSLGSAKEALKNNNVSQKEVDHALKKLKDAEKGLTLDGENDSSGGVVDKNKIDGGNQTQKDDKGDTLPSTATNLYNYLLIGFILLAAGITLTIIHIRKRKRQHSYAKGF